MTLKDWLVASDVTIPEFAVKIGRTTETVRRYVAGERIPDKETMPRIAAETGGQVTANDFFGITTPLAPVVCENCELRLDDPAVSACESIGCTHRQREAA